MNINIGGKKICPRIVFWETFPTTMWAVILVCVSMKIGKKLNKYSENFSVKPFSLQSWILAFILYNCKCSIPCVTRVFLLIYFRKCNMTEKVFWSIFLSVVSTVCTQAALKLTWHACGDLCKSPVGVCISLELHVDHVMSISTQENRQFCDHLSFFLCLGSALQIWRAYCTLLHALQTVNYRCT